VPSAENDNLDLLNLAKQVVDGACDPSAEATRQFAKAFIGLYEENRALFEETDNLLVMQECAVAVLLDALREIPPGAPLELRTKVSEAARAAKVIGSCHHQLGVILDDMPVKPRHEPEVRRTRDQGGPP
jgi:hypothetical protein